MDNIPVDGPTPQTSYQPQSQQQQGGAAATSSTGGGGLNFDENLKDIPQELAGQQQQQQQQTSSSSSTSNFNSSTSNLSAYPSVLAPAPTPHHFSPAPGIPPNAPPQTLPPLVQQPLIGPNGEVIQPPVKRPRGRPRKIPGTESRPRPEGTTAGRGRPKGSRGTRGRGRPRGSGMKARGKRGRASSSEDEDEDISVGDSSEEEGGRGSKRGRKEKDDDEDEEVDLNEEVDDDFGPEGKVRATTKFGRKISKPKSFVPTNKPTITRKKRSAMSHYEATLTCQTCLLGHSPPGNALVICDSCSKGYHQLCHVPILTDELVGSDLPFFCRECDEKISEMRKPEDVTEGEWTTGQGENKIVTPQALPVPPATTTTTGEGDKKDGEGEGAGEGADKATTAEIKAPEYTEEEKEAEKAKPYSKEVKKEWLLSLPLNTLVGYILSVEEKYAPTDSPENGLPIWPKDLPQKLQDAKDQRAAEAAERERRLEEEAEALAAAVAAAETPGGGTETNSEVGTPLNFDILQPGDVAGGGARTAASKRLQGEKEAREQGSSTSSGSQPQSQSQQQQQRTNSNAQQQVPAYMRPAIPMASALGASGGGGDIQVGGSSSTNATNGVSNPTAVALAHQQATQAAQAVQAQAQAQANRYAAYPSYSSSSSQPSNNNNNNSPYGAGYGFLSGSAGVGALGGAGGLAGTYQAPAPGAYANLYAQQPSQQQQQGGFNNGSGSPWDRSQGGN